MNKSISKWRNRGSQMKIVNVQSVERDSSSQLGIAQGHFTKHFIVKQCAIGRKVDGAWFKRGEHTMMAHACIMVQRVHLLVQYANTNG